MSERTRRHALHEQLVELESRAATDRAIAARLRGNEPRIGRGSRPNVTARDFIDGHRADLTRIRELAEVLRRIDLARPMDRCERLVLERLRRIESPRELLALVREAASDDGRTGTSGRVSRPPGGAGGLSGRLSDIGAVSGRLGDTEELSARLGDVPLRRVSQDRIARLLTVADDPRLERRQLEIAASILTAVRGGGRIEIERLDDLLLLEHVEKQLIDALRAAICPRLGSGPKPPPDGDSGDDPDGDSGDDPGDGDPPEPDPWTQQIGVLLPVRLETRFVQDDGGHLLKLRIVPDEVWLARHDPLPNRQEIRDLQAYLRADRADGPSTDGPGDGPDRDASWAALVRHHGGGRAVWLVRTFAPLADEDGTLDPEAAGIALRREPFFPRLEGLPPQLEVWLARGGATPERVAVLDVDHDQLTLDLPIPDDADAPGADDDGDGPVPPDPELLPRWWESWELAQEVGLGATIALGDRDDDIDVLYVVGVGGGDPAELFSDHRDTGQLSLLAAGTPTASVDGADVVDLEPPPAVWDDARQRTLEVLTDPVEQHLARALTGDASSLTGMPGEAASIEQPMVAALWPALWGHHLRDVLGIGAGVDAAGDWAAGHLAPRGPFPTLRVGAQPYGVLPVTALSRWQPATGDPDIEAAMLPSLATLTAAWAQAAESGGTAVDADAADLLRLLSATPTSQGLVSSDLWPLEVWLLGFATTQGSSFTIGPDGLSWEGLNAAWDADHPLLAELGVDPERRYARRGYHHEVTLPLVGPDDDRMPVRPVLEELADLAEGAGDGPGALTDTSTLLQRLREDHGEVTDTLVVRLVIRSLQLAVADTAAGVADAAGRRPLDAWAIPPSVPDVVASRIMQVADGGDVDGTRVTALQRTIDAVRGVAVRPASSIHEELLATLDCATHRIDAWATGIATRRLEDALDHADDDVSPLALGVYGWVEAPRPVAAGSEPTGAGLLHAPSEAQATTAAILRDRARHDPDPDRWQLGLDSRSARTADRLASQVRNGRHLGEVLGAEVEQLIDAEDTLEAVRTAFPGTDGEEGGRCDGLAVVEGELGSLELDGDALAGIDDLRRAVDAYGDLLVATAVHDVVRGRPEHAGATLDAAAGLARPPTLDVLHTEREGTAVRTRCLSVLTDVPEPAADHGPDHARSPGRILDPAVAALLVSQIGAAGDWTWQLESPSGSTVVSLATCSLEPIDAVAMSRGDLERLVRRYAPDEGEVAMTDRAGSDRHDRALRLLAALATEPALARHLDDDADGADPDPTLVSLRARLGQLRATGEALVDHLEQLLGGGDDALDTALEASWRWGIITDPATETTADPAPDAPTPATERAQAVIARLRARLDRAPGGPDRPDPGDLDASDLARAMQELASATGAHVALGRLPVGALPDGLAVDTGVVRDDWLPTMAAVREPLARVDGVQLAEELDGAAPFTLHTDRLDDVWQTAVATADPNDPDADGGPLHVLLVAGGLPTGDPGASHGPGAAEDELVAVGLVDRWAETVPGTHHSTGAAFGFDAPASRPPQAILLAVPPDPDVPLDGAAVTDMLAETRQLLRARAASPDELASIGASMSGVLLPRVGPTQVTLAPTEGDDA